MLESSVARLTWLETAVFWQSLARTLQQADVYKIQYQKSALEIHAKLHILFVVKLLLLCMISFESVS